MTRQLPSGSSGVRQVSVRSMQTWGAGDVAVRLEGRRSHPDHIVEDVDLARTRRPFAGRAVVGDLDGHTLAGVGGLRVADGGRPRADVRAASVGSPGPKSGAPQ